MASRAEVRAAYEGYAASTGGKTFDGRDMPAFGALPERTLAAWSAAIDALDRHRAAAADPASAPALPPGRHYRTDR